MNKRGVLGFWVFQSWAPRLPFSVLTQRQFGNNVLGITNFSVVLRKEIQSGVENEGD